MNIITLDPSAVAEAVNSAAHETDAMVAIFRMVHPEWDDIERFEEMPACNGTTWKRICNLFMEKTDQLNKGRAYDKQLFRGGYWLNSGFTCIDGEILMIQYGALIRLKDWQVLQGKVTMKPSISPVG